MASRPTQAFFERQIAEQGGWDVILERIANGESQTSIAESYGVTQGWLSRILNQEPGRKAALQAAKREAASVYAEQARDIADTMPLDREAIAKGRERIAVRRWLASVYDRDQYGERPEGVNVTVSIEQWHLDALRHRMVQASLPLAAHLAADRAADLEDGSLGQIGPHSQRAGAECEQSLTADSDTVQTPQLTEDGVIRSPEQPADQ